MKVAMRTASDEAISILLIEDNEMDVEIARRALARTGENVDLHIARDGNEALEFLRPGQGPKPKESELPRLLLLDLRLPGIDGWRLLQWIKNDPELCAIPVAVLTGLSGERQMLECMALGGNMFFVKPMQVSDVASLIPAIRKYWKIMESFRDRPVDRAA